MEGIVKLVAAYPAIYFTSPWNVFDYTLLLLNFTVTGECECQHQRMRPDSR